MRSIFNFSFRYLLVACTVAAAVYSFVLARAGLLFLQDTSASVPAAVRLVPYNSEYLSRLAAWRPAERIALLHRAVDLNPFDFESWIQLGLGSEFQQHDNSAAERYYLQAAQVDKMFLPKWTLTNFYFRHGNLPQFFRWAKATLEITPYSPEPVFMQMWLISQDAAKIGAAVPDRPRVLLPYAWFLSNNHQNSLIPPVVGRLIDAVGSRNPRAWGRDDLLAAIEDRLVAAGDPIPAMSVWEKMVGAGWLQKTVPTTARPITNGNFRTPFYGHGFDWVPVAGNGAHVDQLPAEGTVSLRLSGDEPEQCILLEEYIPLAASRAYRLQWHAQSKTLEAPSGLKWHIRPVLGSASAELVSGDLLASSSAGWEFRCPANAGLYLLTLEYARPLGQLRAKGSLILRSVSASTE